MSKTVVTTTAMARPELLERTYRSFCENVEGLSDCPVIINVDPVPSSPDNAPNTDACIAIARRYFRNVTATSGIGNFTNALMTVWEKACEEGYDYIFHLEDDWVLKEKVKLIDLMSILGPSDIEIYQCCLRAYHINSKYRFGYLCSLSPNLIKRRAADRFLDELCDCKNPEIQIRAFCTRNERYSHNNVAVVGDTPIVEDIGLQWRNERNIGHDNNVGGNWTTWIRQSNGAKQPYRA